MMHHNQVNRLSARGVLKGMLERMFLFFSFINGFPHSLTVFGALKIATRLKDKDDSIANDYFLIGNLISVMLSIIYYMVWKNILGNG